METTPDRRILIVNNKIGELTRLEAFLENLGRDWDLSFPLVYAINLALEEALANIITYGYDDEDQHDIEIAFVRNGDVLTMSVTDDGHKYDPTLNSNPDVTLPIGERPVGGLGIFLIRKIMDKVDYQWSESKNHLILTKKIES